MSETSKSNRGGSNSSEKDGCQNMKKRSILWLVPACLVVAGTFGYFFFIRGYFNNIQINEKLDKDILAVVNGFRITEDYFNKRFQDLPDAYKSAYKTDKEEFLEQLIMERMLVQEAGKMGMKAGFEYNSDQAEQNSMLIKKLFSKLTEDVDIEEFEIREFYKANKAQMHSNPYEQVKLDIEDYLTVQKKNQIIEGYVKELQKKSTVVKNEKWLKAQQVLKPKNPLNEVLNNGRPTVVDFGAQSCVPCKMMKPIFEELEKEYRGRADILLIEIYDHRDLAAKYRIRAIPTQVFFDKNGIEKWRHEGFLSKEEIVKKLEELG